MADVTTRLILNVQGQDQLKQLSAEHEKLREHVVGLIKSHREFDAALKDPAIIDAATNLRKVEEQIEKIDGSLGKTTRSWGNAAVQWSRAAQDFQAAGFAGIANNMELMVASLGGPAILAGVATIVGTFGPVIARKIASMFEDGVREGTTHLESLEIKLKELEGKKTKVWLDYIEIENAREQIEKLKRAHEELQKVLGRQTRPEAESGKAVSEALAATPEARAAIERVVVTERARLVTISPQVQAAQREAREADQTAREMARIAAQPGMGLESLAQAGRAEQDAVRRREALKIIQGDAARQAEAQIAERLRQAREGVGPDQGRAQEWLIRQLRGTGMEGGFAAAEAIRVGSPMEMARQDQEKEEEKRQRQAEQEQRKRENEEQRTIRERESQTRKSQLEMERAAHEAQRSLNEEIREQNRQERDDQRQADERIRERDRMAREAMRDPRIRSAVEMGFVQGGTSEVIGPNLGKFLSQQGLAPEAEAPFVGAAAASQVKEDLNRRLSGYVAQGMDRTQAFAAIQEEVLTEMQKLDQKIMLMEQSLMRQQGMIQGFKQTRLNRGDMP